MSTTTRSITSVTKAIATSDGAGVSLSRSLGTPKLPLVDPFLMLDEFRSDNPGDYIAGFPSHPHRGFETVTIMLAGEMQHKDSRGNTGTVCTMIIRMPCYKLHCIDNNNTICTT